MTTDQEPKATLLEKSKNLNLPRWSNEEIDFILECNEILYRLIHQRLNILYGESNEIQESFNFFESQSYELFDYVNHHVQSKPDSRVSRIISKCDLNFFEQQVFLICVGIEVDSRIPHLLAQIHPYQKPQPTYGMVLDLLFNPELTSLSPTSPLRFNKIIGMNVQSTFMESNIYIDERVMLYLLGQDEIDSYLNSVLIQITESVDLSESYQSKADNIFLELEMSGVNSNVVIQINNKDRKGVRDIFFNVCERLNLRLFVMQDYDVPEKIDDREDFLAYWRRENIFSDSILLIEVQEETAKNLRAKGAILNLLDRLPGCAFVNFEVPLELISKDLRYFEVQNPGQEEQKYLWKRALGKRADSGQLDLDKVVLQFNLTPNKIKLISQDYLMKKDHKSDDFEVLWQSCRDYTRTNMEGLATVVRSKMNLDDLALIDDQKGQIQELINHVRHRRKVYEEWGFSRKTNKGLGLLALFSGPPGTGKSMAAEVIANELRLDLYRINLSAVVSKYIGETNKNLDKIFDFAEESGNVLLFDEADALFGKRSEVKDSHDKHANQEVAFLLQRIENYRGLAILTSNFKVKSETTILKHMRGSGPELINATSSSMDNAFVRRLRFIVNFTLPDHRQRVEIWKKMFPVPESIEDIDYDKLGKLTATGAMIKNIALSAAFSAANDDKKINMEYLYHAAKNEFRKVEKGVNEMEIINWLQK